MEYEIKPPKKIDLGLKELWQYKELFYFFTWRDIKVKYKQTFFGFAWAVFQPLMLMVIFTLFFGGNREEGLPYTVFSFSGLILWNIFSTGVTSAGNSMVTNANIIKKIYFPRLIIPISSILVSVFDFIMAFVVFLILLFYYKIHISFLFLPMTLVALVIAIVSTFGMGTLLAALNIKYRDFRYVIPFMLQAMLFATPVILPVTVLAEKYQYIEYILAVNPMYSAIELFRYGFDNQPLQMNLLLLSLTSALFFFVFGIYYFRKTEAFFADIA